MERSYDAREYWQKRLAEKWGLHGVGCVSYGRPYNRWLYRLRRQIFLRVVRSLPLIFPDVAVLDVGSGTGYWIGVWKSLSVRSVTGLDIAPVVAERLREEHPSVRIVELDVSTARFPEDLREHFEIVSAMDVLFHITEDQGFRMALTNIAASLKPGGYLIFSDNFVSHQGNRDIHQVQRPASVIGDELSRAGFRILQRVPTFAIMNVPVRISSPFVRLAWRAFMYPVHLIPSLGHVYGAVLFPVELILTRVFNVRTSTELAICQKQ